MLRDPYAAAERGLRMPRGRAAIIFRVEVAGSTPFASAQAFGQRVPGGKASGLGVNGPVFVRGVRRTERESGISRGLLSGIPKGTKALTPRSVARVLDVLRRIDAEAEM